MPKMQKETPVRKQAQLRFSTRGYRLFRSAVGLLYTRQGEPVKVGHPGVSDLVGWRDYTVQPGDVGRTLAVFTAVEVKQGRGALREEQERFLSAVKAAGGEAWVTRDENDARWAGEERTR